jgi:hypothetical protein
MARREVTAVEASFDERLPFAAVEGLNDDTGAAI